MPLIKPAALRKGATIGIIAPCSGLPDPEQLPLAVRRLEGMGYRIKVGGTCYAKEAYLAGPDALRADDVNTMFRDDTVDAILCARGGYGATRILSMLDYDAIRANPKVFSGYSDVTAFHAAIMAKTGLCTFHGLMAASDFGQETVDAFSAQAFFRAVGDPMTLGLLQNPPGYPLLRAVVPGRAEGPLIGGNLSLMAALLGTPYLPDVDGCILFLEDVDEAPYALDRYLTHLKSAGVLDRVAGIVLGDFKRCGPEGEEGARGLWEMFGRTLADLPIPVLSGLRVGHCTPKLTLPLGARCLLDADEGTLTMLEGAVR